MSARPTRAAARRRKEKTMNIYEITFTRENGTTGSDRFYAPDEKQARKDFRECYRHSTGTITEVKLASENVPASKEQERKALENIRAIVATLGPDSYLATAFAGCFEDAESNIENDFADSMKERYESSKRDSEHFHEAAITLRNDLDKSREELAAIKAELEDAQNKRMEAEDRYNTLVDRTTAAESRAEAAEAEITSLKAKLYDYIVAGA